MPKLIASLINGKSANFSGILIELQFLSIVSKEGNLTSLWTKKPKKN